MRIVLHAHPDRWTVNAPFPPEERGRLAERLLGFSTEWLGNDARPVEVEAVDEAVEDDDAQRSALSAWRDAHAAWRRAAAARRGDGGGPENGRGDRLRGTLEAALHAVVTGALWESPVFRQGDRTLRFHRAWRVLLEIPAGAPADPDPLSARWLLTRR